MRRFLFAAAVAMPFAASAAADPVADFYRGRTLTLTVGYSAGGGYDAYARVLARHMGAHIPGNPTIVAQNMPGAGSLRAVNYLYNAAPKDGSTFGTFGRGLAMEPLIGDSAAQFDATRLTWIGSGTDEPSVCLTWHTSPVKTWNDMLTTPFTVGGEGSGSDPDIYSAVLKNMFGVKLKLITGYPGTAEIILALERGEIEGRCAWSWSTLKVLRPEWISEKKVNLLLQMSLHITPELGAVPLLIDLATTERQRQVLRLVLSREVMGRPFAAPPGIPPERKAALRAAFDATMADPHFVTEAKARGLSVNPASGAEIEELVRGLYATARDVIEETRAVIRPAQ
jgi:tripartite-type tricarboxylate transporter receptor subunit TctC